MGREIVRHDDVFELERRPASYAGNWVMTM